jgi:hypothetical protein
MGSLGLVGEVFEVKTQVDRDLTTVSRVDQQLGLNKNLRRHRGPFAREAIHKIERKERREIICEEDRSTRRKQPQV